MRPRVIRERISTESPGVDPIAHSPQIRGVDARRRPGLLHRLGRRLWFPMALLIAVAVAFVALGPLSQTPAGEPLLAVAPPGASLSEPFVAAAGASATEQEIAKRFETVRQAPDTVLAYVLLGNAYLQHVRETGDPSDYGRAAAAFEEALRREPENVDALIGQGVLRLARHQFRDALEPGRRALELAPSTARVYGVIVDAQTELGMYDEAVASTQRMVDLRPDLASYSRVSYQRELRGDVDGAIEAMDRAFRAATGTSVENREYVRVLIGDLYLLNGDARTAERIQRASLEAAPDFVWALAGLARARAAQGDLDGAVGLYQRAVDAIPLPEFVIALGETQQAAGRTEEAGRSYELVRAIQQLFAVNGVNVDLDLALFEADHGSDPGGAVELARRAYADQPNLKAADALGWALHKNGQHDEARRYAEESLRLGSPYARYLFHAGMIASAQGDTEAARGYLKRSIDDHADLMPLYRQQAEAELGMLGG